MVILPSIRRKYMNPRIPKGATVPMSECVVTLASDSVSYTGGPRTVGVTVTWGGEALSVNADYTLSFANNVNLGPATVTVTGMGQFSGNVTKTYYVVSGADVPWTFDISDATLEGDVSLSGIQYVLPLVENYDGGSAVLPIHKWSSNEWLIGRALPRDGSDEYHLANLASNASVLDGSGASGSLYPFYFSPSKSGWYSTSSKVLKMKGRPSGEVSSFDFSDTLSINIQTPPCFANGGRLIFVFEGSYRVCSFSLSNPYDITTVDVASRKVVDHFLDLSGYSTCTSCIFSPNGMQAIVTTSESDTVYHVSLDQPYDLSGADVIASLNTAQRGCRVVALTNGGNTLFLGNSGKLYEYSLSS